VQIRDFCRLFYVMNGILMDLVSNFPLLFTVYQAAGDCGAVESVYGSHHYTKSMEEGVAAALINGTALDCGGGYQKSLESALQKGFVTRLFTIHLLISLEALIDQAVKQVFYARFKLGMFDAASINDLKRIPLNATNTPEHRQKALEIARETIILLKNDKNQLPLSKSLKSIAIIGPNADDESVMYGNYAGTNDRVTTPLKALKSRSNLAVAYAPGCKDVQCTDTSLFSQAVTAVQQGDAIILTVGINLKVEEEMLDRDDITLPGHQEDLIKTVKMAAGNKPVILVLINGGPITLSNWTIQNIDNIVECIYPGQEGGNALLDVIFGDYNPGGRLPITVYQSLSQVPDFVNMSMAGRTYRYNNNVPQFYFGDGMSYTQFKYSDFKIDSEVKTCSQVHATVQVHNVGDKDGDEVVQLYVKNRSAKVPVPLLSLAVFARVHIPRGQSVIVHLSIQPQELSVVLDNGDHVVQQNSFTAFIGGNHPLSKMSFANHLESSFNVTGETKSIDSC
jgi:beta-glucosidase